MSQSLDSAKAEVSSSDNTLTEGEVSGFRTIFKNTSLFGGVQVFNVLIALARGKLLAVLIGTAGMGLNGLLLSGLNLINRFSGLGLSESAVRDISAAYSTGDEKRIRRVYTVFNRWIWLSALLGLVLTVVFAPFLSRFAFGDGSRSVSFMVLSSTFIFGALTGGVYALLRGIQRIKDLALANIIGSSLGLLVIIPIYYFYRIEGVVAAIIAGYAVNYIVSIRFRRKADIKPVRVSLRDTFHDGKQMAALGITLSLGGLLSEGSRFILSAYVSKTGSLSDLGVFNAGQSIMEGYVGMVFVAMGTDYYPRLCAVIDKADSWKVTVNRQIEVILLILGPLLAAILLTSPILVRILLSNEFLPATGYINMAAPAIILKGIVWAMGFIIIAHGNKKLFLYVQLAGSLVLLPVSFILYHYLAITGLGIAVLITNLFAAILMVYVIRRHYEFVLSGSSYQLAAIYLLLLGLSILFLHIAKPPMSYWMCAIIFFVTVIISVKGLNRRMDLHGLLQHYFTRRP